MHAKTRDASRVKCHLSTKSDKQCARTRVCSHPPSPAMSTIATAAATAKATRLTFLSKALSVITNGEHMMPLFDACNIRSTLDKDPCVNILRILKQR